MRIKKLKEKVIIDQIVGVNLNKVGIYVALVSIRTTNTTKILNLFRDCPFFLNGFVTSGEKNLMLLLAGEDLASLESMIDSRIRPDEDVQSADFNINQLSRDIIIRNTSKIIKLGEKKDIFLYIPC